MKIYRGTIVDVLKAEFAGGYGYGYGMGLDKGQGYGGYTIGGIALYGPPAYRITIENALWIEVIP